VWLHFLTWVRTYDDDDVLNEDWIVYRMVRPRHFLSLVLVAIGVDRRILKEWNGIEYTINGGTDDAKRSKSTNLGWIPCKRYFYTV
jgi:hypothetical protein